MDLFQQNSKLQVRQIDFATACYFVNKHHRHNKAPIGHKFSLGCFIGSELVGVSMCGRPVSRHLDNGNTLEINRLSTNGTRNACSKLYAASCRYAKLKGYKQVITYTLMSENGASLKGANFTLDKENAGGVKWTGNRKYTSTELKNRWVYILKA